MNGYLITFFILIFISLGAKLALHGKLKEGNENFWITLFSTLLTLWLLYMGGCFNHI